MNYVQGTDISKYQKGPAKYAIIHYVDYSLDELNNIKTMLYDKMESLEIVSMGLNVEENKVFIAFENLDDSHIEKVKEVIDPSYIPAIEFKEDKLKLTF